MDYNSMYPSIMNWLQVPTDLNNFKVFIYTDHIFVNNRQAAAKIGLECNFYPLEINPVTNSFIMSGALGSYDLFELSQFKFKDSTLSPQFGVVTKDHGTIYPLQYNIELHR